MRIKDLCPGDYAKVTGTDVHLAKKQNQMYCVHAGMNKAGTCIEPNPLSESLCEIITEDQFKSNLESVESDDWFTLMIKEGLLTNKL